MQGDGIPSGSTRGVMQAGAGEFGEILEVAAVSAIARMAFGRKCMRYAVLS